MNFDNYRLDVADGIATVTFDRPPVNAQNRQTREEAIRIFDMISDRDDIRVAILTGAGKVFSAGADVKERVGLAKEPGDYVRHNRLAREYFYALSDCSKPVICAVNGAAFGAGFLMQHFGKSMARYMYFTARRIPATELYRLGVISACVPREKLMDEAMTIAREIAAKSPKAVREIKRAFNVVEEMPTRDGYRYEQTITVDLSHTEDAKEAQQAFVEKRKPVFKGR